MAEVDPDDLKTMWQKIRKLQADLPGRYISLSSKAIANMGADAPAVWYRTRMILVLSHVAQEPFSPWINDDEASGAVFRMMATVPMKWIPRS